MDLFPRGPQADRIARAWLLAATDRLQIWNDIVGIVGVGGFMAEAQEAVSAAIPFGQESRLDTREGQLAVLDRACQIMLAIETHPPTCVH